jgi:hypothetical protein
VRCATQFSIKKVKSGSALLPRPMTHNFCQKVRPSPASHSPAQSTYAAVSSSHTPNRQRLAIRCYDSSCLQLSSAAQTAKPVASNPTSGGGTSLHHFVRFYCSHTTAIFSLIEACGSCSSFSALCCCLPLPLHNTFRHIEHCESYHTQPAVSLHSRGCLGSCGVVL